MKRMLAVLVLAAMCASFAIAADTKKPAADKGARVAELDEQLATIVDKDKADCDKMATEIKAFVAKNGKELHQLGEEGKNRTPEQQAAFKQKYGARIQGAMQKMNGGIVTCHTNPKVMEALKGLN